MKIGTLSAMIAAVLVAVGLMAGSVAEARKPVTNGAPPSSIALNQTDAHLGDWVTFSTSYPSTVSAPRIQVMCYQGDVLVYGEAGPASQSFLLGGGMSLWLMAGGEADCVATLYQWDWHPQQTFVSFATVAFHAGAAR